MSPPTAIPDSAFSAPIDLRRVRRLFASPARIAASDFLRREVASRMRERLELVKIAPQRVLDAGCGVGADLAMLQKRFHDAQVLAIDASLAMLVAAQQRQVAAQSSVTRLLNSMLNKWLPGDTRPSAGSNADLLCGDFARLPFGGNSLDLVWSNLALHWHPQPDRVFAEWRRVLRVDGLLMFSCFGPDTFKELRGAFAAAGTADITDAADATDATPHALPFVDMHDFGDMLVNAGFSTPVMDMETITVTYESIDKLLAEVRAFGGNPLSSRRHSLTGRRAWQRMRVALDSMRRADGRIPLSFEVIYGHAFRPVPKIRAGGEAIIRLDMPKKRK